MARPDRAIHAFITLMRAAEVLRIFLLLGLTSFGGPVAHLNYFRREFVEQRGWLTAADYAALVSLCQFLPGPASSQTGFCIGLRRAGWLGGLAAWVGFTLPSALLMYAFARNATWFNTSRLGHGLLHGLQLAAIAVVAQAVWVMARSLCPDSLRRALAVVALLVMAASPGAAGQMAVLVIGGLAGRYLLTPPPNTPAEAAAVPLSHTGSICLGMFFLLLAFALLFPAQGNLGLFNAFYRTGALVFGGGHVVLPLLHGAIVNRGWVPEPLFLAGYGAAQAMPGPLFTFAAYLGALASTGSGGATGATIALVAIFLPGLLLVAVVLPIWNAVRQNPRTAAAVMGLNAAVVGLLAYALLSLVTSGAIHGILDTAIALAALLALTIRKTAPLIVVGACAAAGVLLAV
jgi:chromate transporter